MDIKASKVRLWPEVDRLVDTLAVSMALYRSRGGFRTGIFRPDRLFECVPRRTSSGKRAAVKKCINIPTAASAGVFHGSAVASDATTAKAFLSANLVRRARRGRMPATSRPKSALVAKRRLLAQYLKRWRYRPTNSKGYEFARFGIEAQFAPEPPARQPTFEVLPGDIGVLHQVTAALVQIKGNSIAEIWILVPDSSM